MATNSLKSQLDKTKAENAKLKADNKSLRQQLSNPAATTDRQRRRPLRVIISILLIALAAAVLIACNLLLWAGNTVVKNDRFVAATEPLITNPEIQKALASNATNKLFANVNVEQLSTEVLPPRADFLAPAIADQVEAHTETTIQKILARPQFQDRWNTALGKAHQRFIASVERNGSDGAIDVSEVYSNISGDLKNTKLSFLADKPLPAKVGNVQLVEGAWLTNLQRVIQNIDSWRAGAIAVWLVLSALGVYLARHRRRAVILMGSLFAFGMFFTLVSGRVAREVIASKADPAYAEAVRQAYTTVMHSLVVQTTTIMLFSILIAVVAWISGPYRSSRWLRGKIDQLLSGKLHEAIFPNENRFTLWVGKYKQVLQWLTVAAAAIALLIVRLTPTALYRTVVVVVLAVLVIDLLAAKKLPVKTM